VIDTAKKSALGYPLIYPGISPLLPHARAAVTRQF